MSVVFPLPLVRVPVPGDDTDGVDVGSDEGDTDGAEDAGTTGLGVITVAIGADEGALVGAIVGALEDGAVVVGLNEVGVIVGALEDGAVVVGLNGVGCNVVGASVATTGANVGDAVGPPPPCDVGLAVGNPVKLSASHPYCPGVTSAHRRLDSSVSSQGRNSTPEVPFWTTQWFWLGDRVNSPVLSQNHF